MPSSDRDTYQPTPKAVKKLVIQRANHCCEVCGKHVDHLEVHHIIARAILENLVPSKQNDPSILTALCLDCHETYDMINKEQIRIFKKVNTERKEPMCQISFDDLLEGGIFYEGTES